MTRLFLGTQFCYIRVSYWDVTLHAVFDPWFFSLRCCIPFYSPLRHHEMSIFAPESPSIMLFQPLLQVTIDSPDYHVAN